MNSRNAAWAVGLAALIALPFVYRDPYHLHILVLILIFRPRGLMGAREN